MTEALEAEYEALLTFLYLCPVGVVQIGPNGAVNLMNPHAAQLLLPLTRSTNVSNLFEAFENCAPELRNLTEAFGAERGHICQGHRIHVSLNARGPRVLSCSLLKVSADCLVAVLQDVTREVEQERQIKQSEALYAALVAGINDFALFSLDGHGRINTWNSSGVRQTGFAAADVIGRDLEALCHAGDAREGRAAELVLAAAREGWSLCEERCVRRNGTLYWCQILVSATEGPDGTVSGYSVVMRDVMERRLNGEELRRLLTTDHLTGATNRARFFELAEAEVARHARSGRPLSAIMIDVDHFKRINDTFGHATGDALLRALVGCCRACLRDGDTLARIGGEEFAVLMPDTNLSSAALVAERMREAAAAQLASLSGVLVSVTISLGCAEMTPDHDGFDAMLNAADGALYQAKRSGRNKVLTTATCHEAGELVVA